MPDPIADGCARIFREVIGDSHPINIAAWDDARLLATPIEEINVDSLTLLDFVMQVENVYGVELNEAEVNNCLTIGELAAMVAPASLHFSTEATEG